ncbi:MAG TPA: biopolymer transporter ExbD [Bryobacteraceae bacterium]|jgi:biopolymer transport protein ExbD
MAMSLGGGKQSPQINVTPMIDVLLVLLIIFILILPSNSHGLATRIPQKDDNSKSSQPDAPAVVITVEENKRVLLNQEPLALSDLGRRLTSLFGRGENGPVIFVRAKKDLSFEDVAAVIDVAKGAGLIRIALMTDHER